MFLVDIIRQLTEVILEGLTKEIISTKRKKKYFAKALLEYYETLIEFKFLSEKMKVQLENSGKVIGGIRLTRDNCEKLQAIADDMSDGLQKLFGIFWRFEQNYKHSFNAVRNKAYKRKVALQIFDQKLSSILDNIYLVDGYLYPIVKALGQLSFNREKQIVLIPDDIIQKALKNDDKEQFSIKIDERIHYMQLDLASEMDFEKFGNMLVASQILIENTLPLVRRFMKKHLTIEDIL